MKKFLSFIVLFFMGMLLFAQAPQKFTYQAVVRNESNTLVRGNVGVRITILQGGANGTMVYQETHTAVTNANGLMTLQIGGGTVVNGDFATIDWADGPYFLKTETDPTGGSNYTIEGTQQLLSVPYALYAGHAANSFSGSYNDLTDQPDIPQIPENVSAFNNDAGYITMDSIPEIPTVPTNVSAFTNDAGYITMDSIPEIPTIPTNVSAFINDAGYVTQSTQTTENYITQNDLITNNYVTEADIPTNVSAFNNDAGYITMDSIPEIPTVPTNVSAFVNDAGYVTQSTLTTENYITQNDLITNNYVTEADIPTNVSAFTNDAGYITMDSIPVIPTVPTNVSAFVNDAGYVTQSTLTTENYITQNDLITNNYVTEADIPTNVSAFTNDAGYITMDSIPVIPTVPTNVSAFTNDAGYITESTLTTENYITQNDLITNNYVTEADIPTNVSAFNNDAGYITMDSIPAIPIVPTNVSAFTNDAGYITESTLANNNYITQNDLITNNYVTEADIPTNVSAFTNDAGYITMDSVPAIPTNVSVFTNDAGYITNAAIPTNISAFTNDAGYLTSATVQEAANIPTNVSAFANDANYITLAQVPAQVNADWNATSGAAQIMNKPTLFDGDYNSLANRPELFSGSYNDLTDQPTLFSGDYNDLSNQPEIPTVPTNVSAFTNDANYITIADVPAIPTNVSAFANDANYITAADVPEIPTNVSAFTNDAGYLTSFTEQQMLTISNDTLFLTGGSFVKLPAGFDGNYNSLTNRPELFSGNYNDLSNRPDLFSGDYNDLTNQPTIPTVPTQVSAFENDANYITSADVPAIPTNVSAFTNDANYITTADIPAYQVLSISNDTIYLSNGGYAVLPAGFDGNYNSLSNKPDLFSGNYNDLTNKPTIPTVPTNVSAFTNDANYITSADVPAIPTNVSSFTNDAGYITMDSIPAIPTVPTNVSAFTNDAGYLTSFTEQQILSISNDTIYLTGGSFVKLPAGFSGSYNDLTDVPENVSTFSNDAGYLTRDSLSNYNISPADIQSLLDRIADLEQQIELPVLNTAPVTSLSSTAAVSGGAVVSSRSAVAARGVCWNTIGNPTISDDYSIDGSGIGDFTSSLSSLTPATTYYVRAYATNDAGTGYGPVIVFTTLGVPAMTTNYADNINGTVATVHCSVISDNGANITEYGVCWNTTGAPTVSDQMQAAVLGLSDYEVNLTSLTPAVTYYVRAYAVNSEGIGYGNVITFITANDVPYVTTSSVSPIDDTSVGCGGDVTADNGSPIIARGVCWSTNPNPTIADNHTVDGIGTGSFTSVLTGLSVGVTYYVRAYATNSTGTGYGEQKSFSTWLCGTSTLTDIDGNIYNTVLIGAQCWMKENLKTTRYADGTSISQGSSTSTETAYWYYPNNDASNKTTYGLLYNWKAVMRNSASSSANPSGVQGICPTGWHVPSEAEFTQLTDYVGSQSQYQCKSSNLAIGKALASISGWNSSSNSCAVGMSTSFNNAAGFSALPAGRYNDNGYYVLGREADFWSSTVGGNHQSTLHLFYNNSGAYLIYSYTYYSQSVRCLRD